MYTAIYMIVASIIVLSLAVAMVLSVEDIVEEAEDHQFLS